MFSELMDMCGKSVRTKARTVMWPGVALMQCPARTEAFWRCTTAFLP